MPNMLRFGAIFVPSYLPQLHILPFPSPLSSSTSPLSHFTPPLPFPKEMNNKLSYRGQNTLSIIKEHERNAISEHASGQSRLAGRIMFSICPFVRPSVRLFVRLLPTCERYTSKTHEPISMQIGINLPPGGKGRNGRRRGSGGQRSRSQEAEVMFGSIVVKNVFYVFYFSIKTCF